MVTKAKSSKIQKIPKMRITPVEIEKGAQACNLDVEISPNSWKNLLNGTRKECIDEKRRLLNKYF